MRRDVFRQRLISPHFVSCRFLTQLVSHGFFRDHWDDCSSSYQEEIGAGRMRILCSKACWDVFKGARIKVVESEHTPESTMSSEISTDTNTGGSPLSLFPLQPLYHAKWACVDFRSQYRGCCHKLTIDVGYNALDL